MDEIICEIREFRWGTCRAALGIMFRKAHAKAAERMLDTLGEWQPDCCETALELDEALYENMSRYWSDEIIGAAVAARAWDEGEKGGGIIGAPGTGPESASGRLTEIEPGTWCWAYPGACGFIVRADRETADKCIDIAYRAMSAGREPWGEIVEILKEYTFLYASDASGKEGMLCCGSSGFVKEIRLQ